MDCSNPPKGKGIDQVPLNIKVPFNRTVQGDCWQKGTKETDESKGFALATITCSVVGENEGLSTSCDDPGFPRINKLLSRGFVDIRRTETRYRVENENGGTRTKIVKVIDNPGEFVETESAESLATEIELMVISQFSERQDGTTSTDSTADPTTPETKLNLSGEKAGESEIGV